MLTENRLVLRIYPDKKDEFVNSLVETVGSSENKRDFGKGDFSDFLNTLREIALDCRWKCYKSRIITALKEASICYYTNLKPEYALKHFDFYLRRVDAITLSENLNQLAESTPYHQVLYSTIVKYARDYKFGQLIPKQDRSLENDLLKFALQREQRKKQDMPSSKTY